MMHTKKIGLLSLSAALLVAGCGGSGGGSAAPPPPTSKTYSVMLTGLELTRASDGASIAVSGLPLSSNITVTIDD